MIASAERHEPLVRALLDARADVNVINVYGRTALWYAALYGDRVILRALLEAGADKSIRDRDGVTSQAIAARKGHTDVVKLLEDGGPN